MFLQKKKKSVQTTLTGKSFGQRQGTTTATTARPFIQRTSTKSTTVTSPTTWSATNTPSASHGMSNGLALPKSSLFHSVGALKPATNDSAPTGFSQNPSSGSQVGSEAQKRKLPASFYSADTGNAPGSSSFRTNYGAAPKAAYQRSSKSTLGGPKRPRKNAERDNGAPVALSAEQQRVLDFVFETRRSIFLTGSAGTGKSVVLRAIIDRFQELALKGQCNEPAITAPTGIAALHIGGITIHSFGGIGLGRGTAQELINKITKSRHARDRWLKTDTLIIDEVSMLDGQLFDKLEQIARAIRGSIKPFGGIQLILTGDFYQLPPVERERGTAKFCFEAASWKSCVTETIQLQRVYRQTDNEFIDLLNQIRVGKLTPTVQETLSKLSRTPDYGDDGIMPTELYSLRHDVEQSNMRRLQALPGKAVVFHCRDTPVNIEAISSRLNAICNAPVELTLKVNAQVMLIKNMPEVGLVNGSLGVVKEFRSAEGQVLPLIRFTNGNVLTIEPEVWEYEIDKKVASRKQLPLRLSWAMSIHKSQGQTIDRVLVNLNRIFEKGQAYVALSRATSLKSLQVIGFTPSKVMAHPRVVEYYAKLGK